MWIAKIKLKHDCIIGNRCEKFRINLQSYNLNEEKKGKKVLTSSIHQVVGDKKNIASFVSDLRKDKRTEYIEFDEKTLFLVDSAKNKPVSQFTKRMFFVRPVIIDEKGYEYWEIASHKKEEIINFIKKVEPVCDVFELLTIKNTKLKDVYFPKVLPILTDLQKKALGLAIKSRYYEIPKKTNLRDLAKNMGISLATYQRHLQKAESKVMPDIFAYLK